MVLSRFVGLSTLDFDGDLASWTCVTCVGMVALVGLAAAALVLEDFVVVDE